MRSRTASWVPSTPGGGGEGAGAWAPQIREPRLPNPRKDQDALQRALEEFERAKQRHQELLAQKQPVQIRFRTDPLHAFGTKPPDLTADEVGRLEDKLAELKTETAACGAERLYIPEYMSQKTEGRYAQEFGQDLEKKNLDKGRDWVARLAYDASLMAKFIAARSAEYAKDLDLPDLKYYGYKKLESWSDEYPNAETLLHHMFEKHFGELVSVKDQWRPIYTPLAEAPPWYDEAACGASDPCPPWDPRVFFHNQALSAAQRGLALIEV